MKKFVQEKPSKEITREVKLKYLWQAFLAMLLILFIFIVALGVLWLIVGGLFALCKIIYLVLFTM